MRRVLLAAAAIAIGLTLQWNSGRESTTLDPSTATPGTIHDTGGRAESSTAPPPSLFLDPDPAPARTPLPEPEPEEPPPKARVRIVTAVSHSPTAERVGQIHFELYRARAVVQEDGTSSFRPFALADELLVSGRTDTNGEAIVEVESSLLESRDSRDRPFLRLRIVEPRYQRRLAEPSFRGPDPDGLLRVQAMAVAGATGRGRVVDAQGRGVPAKVRLRNWIEPRGVRKLGGFGAARALADGWFEIDFDKELLGGTFLADAGELGTGALTGIQLQLADPPQSLEIVVSGEGRLRGRVADSRGEPAAGLEMLVWFAAFDDEVGSFVSPEPDYSIERSKGGGQLWVTLTTDEAGRFDVPGLRREPYVIRARVGDERSGYPLLLTPEPVTPDESELALELSRTYLAVSLVSADGSPWPGPSPEPRPSTRYVRLDEWPDAPTIAAFVGDTGGVAQLDELKGRASGTSEVIFEVAADASYLVGATGNGFRGELQRVDVPLYATRVPVELVASPETELGTLEVRVVVDGQELTGRDYSEPAFDVYLEDPSTSAQLLFREQYGEPSPFLLSAPARRYRLVAEGLPGLDDYHGVLMTPRSLGRAELDVEIVAGETRRHTLELTQGARLELLIEGEALEADRDALIERSPHLGDSGNEESLAALAQEASVMLAQAGRRPEVVYTTAEWEGSSAAGTHLQAGWTLGAKQVSQVLPAGGFTLVARMPGGREVRAAVTLEAGAVTSARLEL